MLGQERPESYRDFTVRLMFDPDGASRPDIVAYAVEEDVRASGGRRLPATASFGAGLRGNPQEPASLIPSKLGRLLLPGEVGRRFGSVHSAEVSAGRGVRLRIETDDPRLSAVPWELAGVPLSEEAASERREFLVRRPGLSVVRHHPADGAAVPWAARTADADGTVVVCTALGLSDPGGDFGIGAAGPLFSERETITAALEWGSFARHELPDSPSSTQFRRHLDTTAYGFYFGGHGFPEGILLAGEGPRGAARPELLPAAELAGLLRRAGVAVVLLAGCSTSGPAGADGPEGPAGSGGDSWSGLAETLVRSGVPCVIGMRGIIRHHEAMTLAEGFFKGLAEHRSVENALAVARESMTGGWWLPVLHTSERAAGLRLSPRAEPQDPRGLSAYPVPAPLPRTGRGAPLPQDGGPVRLDVLWGLDRGPFRGVLADLDPAANPASELGAVENGPLRDLTWDPSSEPVELPPRRQWFSIAGDSRRIPGSVAEIRRLARPPVRWDSHLAAEPTGSAMGFVLRFPVEPGGEVVQRAAELAAAVHARLPGAALLVHLTGDDPAPLLDATREAGRRLPPRGGDDSGFSALVATRVLPGPRPEPAPEAPEASGPSAAFSRALAAAEDRPDPRDERAERRERELRKLYDEIVRHDLPMAREAVFLFHYARDADSEDPLPLYALFARERDEPMRAASLAAAATREEHLDHWLAAAEEAGRPVSPSALPPALFPRRVLDTLVLGLLRRGPSAPRDPKAALPPAGLWDGLVSPELRAVLMYLRSDAVPLCAADPVARDAADRAYLLSVRSPCEAATALRAGVGDRLTASDLVAGGDGRLSMAFWAALASRPLRADAVRLLSGRPEAQRRVVGFTREHAERDAQQAEWAAIRKGLFLPDGMSG
ncbi:CHAT domain-containing protein [Streptomyces sp. NPDC046985]|uniref:CHAT domain-containing protein n=1 Tax=Streptomyces sp. NPDC046985 TaxID=3155377 RepID=UPI0033CEDDC6